MNFVQQIGETLSSIDLGHAIGASGFRTIDLIILAETSLSRVYAARWMVP
jgi:hypothetical protein